MMHPTFVRFEFPHSPTIPIFFPSESWLNTDSPSFSCEMIILWNKSHGKKIRVCMGIFMTALRKKKYCQILNNISYLAILPQCVACCLNITMLKRSHFSKLSISRVTTPKRRTFSYIFALTCITKDDHLTAGAWAACGPSYRYYL